MTPNANQGLRVQDPAGCLHDTELQELLKRCSSSTYEAACRFRRRGDSAQIPIIIAGIIEHHVEPELRAKLRTPDQDLRLIEDLGLDSLTLMEVVMLTEDVLRISIGNEELTDLRTLGDVNRLVVYRMCGLPSPPALLTGSWLIRPKTSQTP